MANIGGWVHNFYAPKRPEAEKIPIAGDEEVRVCRHRGLQDGIVVGIPAGAANCPVDSYAKGRFQEFIQSHLQCASLASELLYKHSDDLGLDKSGNREPIDSESARKRLCRRAAKFQRRHPNVGVDNDDHRRGPASFLSSCTRVSISSGV